MAAAMLSTTTSSSTTESADGRNPLQTHPALGVLEKYLDKANPGEITSLHVDIVSVRFACFDIIFNNSGSITIFLIYCVVRIAIGTQSKRLCCRDQILIFNG